MGSGHGKARAHSLVALGSSLEESAELGKAVVGNCTEE